MIVFSVTLAQVSLGRIGGPGEGFGPWANLGDIAAAAGAFTGVISRTLGLLTIVAGLWFVFQLIWGSYDFLYAGAEKERVERAKKRITNAVVGIIITVAAYAIASLVGSMLGFKILDPGSIIQDLGP